MLNLGILFRVALPFSTNLSHIFHNKRLQHYYTSQLNKLYALSEPILANESGNHAKCGPTQPEKKIKTQIPQTSQEESLQIKQQQNIFSPRQSILQKNCISERIKTLQYEANNPCEDSMSHGQLKTINAYTVSIFDGHGGPQLAEYSKQKINEFIDYFLRQNASSNKGKNIGEVLRAALKWSYKKLEDTFYQFYEQQIKIGNTKIKNVGTCAITAIVYNDKVYLGNSGDSQGIFIVSGSKNLNRAQKMNQRLNVNNKNQRQRIIQKWKGKDNDIVVQESNNSFYLKGRLQPTKTIGDYYLKKENHFNGRGLFQGPYLTCDPDIVEYELTKDHKYMVIASDGVWDVLSKNEVMTSLVKQKEIDMNKTWDAEQQKEEAPYLSNILSNILQKSSEVAGKPLQQLKRMEKGKRRSYHDDITIAVISLQNQV